MVLTRRNRMQLGIRPEDFDQIFSNTLRARSTSNAEDCEECSQRSERSYGGDGDYSDAESSSMSFGGPNYRPNDRCKRHRLADDQPKSEVVSSYRRRK